MFRQKCGIIKGKKWNPPSSGNGGGVLVYVRIDTISWSGADGSNSDDAGGADGTDCSDGSCGDVNGGVGADGNGATNGWTTCLSTEVLSIDALLWSGLLPITIGMSIDRFRWLSPI